MQQFAGHFLGLEHQTDYTAGARAVLEGVSFAFKECLLALESTGTSIEKAIAVGGGSRSDYWLHLLATVLNIPIVRPIEGDFGAAFGAARLAQMADLGQTDLATAPKIAQEFEPNTHLKDEFEATYHRFKKARDILADY